MMDSIVIDGVSYHAVDGELILDPYDNEPIESSSCICFAHSSNECCCGAWDYD
jgi:hypothetical protein